MIEQKTSFTDWTKIVVGFLWAIIFSALILIGNNVIANENKRQDSERNILAQISDTKISLAEMRAYYVSISRDISEIKLILKN